MAFDRNLLPDPQGYYEAQGLRLTGRGAWRTTSCEFHGGSDSLRINTKSGAWVCMACSAKGGDVLAYHIARYGLDFKDAARALGAWMDGGEPPPTQKAAPLSPRTALQVLSHEATLAAVAAGNLAQGLALNEQDRTRLRIAAQRITRLAEAYR